MKVAAIVLAAGASSRMGRPKQLLPMEGATLVRRIAERAIDADVSSVFVIVGGSQAQVRLEIHDLALNVVDNADWTTGIGSSIRAGLEAVERAGPSYDAVLVLLADQPYVTTASINRLIDTARNSNQPIVASLYEGSPGVPAIFKRSMFEEIQKLKAEEGAKRIIAMHREQTVLIDYPEGAIDIDTPEDYERINKS